MTEQQRSASGARVAANVVAVHDVGDAGRTGPAVGTGVLVGPEVVLVHPPLASDLAGDPSRTLRAGIAAAGPAGGIVEVVDVDRVVVSAAETDATLVALVLAVPSVVPVDDLGAGDADDLLDAFIGYLDGIDGRPHRPGDLVPPPKRPFYCPPFPGSGLPGCP